MESDAFAQLLDQVDSVVWGPLMLALLLGTGLYLTVRTGFMPVRRIGTAFRLLNRGRRKSGEPGEITCRRAR